MTEAGTVDSNASHFQVFFEHSPIAICVIDLGQLKAHIEEIRKSGETDIREYFKKHPHEYDKSRELVGLADANKKALKLFEAPTLELLQKHFAKLIQDYSKRIISGQIAILWETDPEERTEITIHTLSGKPVDTTFQWTVLPGSKPLSEKVLLIIHEIGQQKKLEKELKASQAHYQALFQDSPISLWVEDFSEVKGILQRLRAKGVRNIRHYLTENPDIVDACKNAIKVTDVNRRTLDLFAAKSLQDLVDNLPLVFREEMRAPFLNQLVDLWEGRLNYEATGINYTLSGYRIDIFIHFSVMPGHEETWDRVLLSIEDMTARKKAEDYLRYFGTHDILTKLYNRTYFEEELSRLKSSRLFPVSIIVADVDGLKRTNDTAGHQAGDDLIRRTAEVLKASFRDEDVVARIGGDEFAVIMPETTEVAGAQAVSRIQRILELNNKYYSGPPLILSIGIATGKRGANLMEVQREADDRMYQEKRKHYLEKGKDAQVHP